MREQARPQALPTPTHEGEEIIGPDGEPRWAWRLGDGRLCWTNRPVGYQCPADHPVYLVVSALLARQEASGCKAA